MAQQGLFTQGPSIDELLSQRNQRGADLQQQLMQQASQGAARPMETQAASLIGSSLGRALAGSLSGGQDKEREALEARNAQQAQFQGTYGELMSRGTPEQQEQGALDFYNAGYIKEAGELKNAAALGLKTEATKAVNTELASSISADNPVLAKMVMAGNEQAIKTALTINSPENEATIVKQGAYRLADGKLVAGYVKGSARFIYGDDGKPQVMPPSAIWVGEGAATVQLTSQEKNLANYLEHKLSIDNAVAKGEMEPSAAQAQLHAIKSALSIAIDPRVAATAKIDAEAVGSFLTEQGAGALRAKKAMTSYSQSIAFLDAGMYTGTGAGSLQGVRKLAIAMGLADDDVVMNAANVEMFRANIMDAVLNRIAETKGSITQKEIDAFAQASIGLDKTVAGNGLLLETARKSEQWTLDRADAINDWYLTQRKDNKMPLRSEIKAFAKQWEDQNKLVLPTAEQILKAKSTPDATVGDRYDNLTNSELINAANSLSAPPNGSGGTP